MKFPWRIFTLLVASIPAVTFSLSAQSSVAVKVTLDGAPLSRAPVSVNGRYYKPADHDGLLSIPRVILQSGDTLSAALVGLKPATAIYGERIDSIFLPLLSDISIDEVVVTANNRPRRYFRKHVNTRRSSFDFAEFQYNFRLDRSDSGTPLAGTFLYADLPTEYRIASGENGCLVGLEEKAIALPFSLDSLLLSAHRAAVMSIPQRSDIDDEQLISFNDNGVVDGRRVFVLEGKASDSEADGWRRSLKTTLRIDSHTNYISSAHSLINRTPGSRIEMEAEYAYNKTYDILYPSKISAVVMLPTGGDSLRCDISMENTKIKRYPRTLAFKSVSKRSTFRITQDERRYNSMISGYLRSYGK